MLVEAVDILLEARQVRYVHFSDQVGAEAIASSRRLDKSSIVNGVYAVAEGGKFVGGVATTKLGRATSRNFAVIFTTKQDPQVVYPEEVIWHADSIKLSSAKVVQVSKAKRLLTGRNIVQNSSLLWETVSGVPWHPSDQSNRLWPQTVVKKARKHIKADDLMKAAMVLRNQTGAKIPTVKQFISQFRVSMGMRPL